MVRWDDYFDKHVSSLKNLSCWRCAADQGVCYYNVPFLLLADTLDCVTLDVCERLFDLIESHVTTWTQPSFFSSGKILLLRMCNDLLRRLSSAQNTVFCGRIQLFLSRLFPLSEKSALNLMSHFNLENVTTYNKTPSSLSNTTTAAAAKVDASKSEVEEGEDMEIDEEAKESISGGPVDFNLYQKLWSLQDFFRQPTQCFSHEQWKLFAANVQEVLQAFVSYKLDEIGSKRRKGKERRASDRPGHSNSHYFAKYLTSEKLMSLQLNDSHFRRHVLIQILILFQYLKVSIKFKSSSQVLTESQVQLVTDMTAKVYQLLEETPPDGQRFADYIRHVLEREETWITWKNDGCPSYERSQQATAESTPPPHIPLGKRVRELSEEKDLGSEELSRLWNVCPDNLEACSSTERMFVPPIEVFLEDAVDQANPKTSIPATDKLVNTPNYSWQALRILSHKSPHFFHPAQAQIKPLGEFLESVIIQTAKTLEQQQQ